MEVKNDVKDLQKRLLNVAILTVVMIVLCVIYRFLMYDGQQGFFLFYARLGGSRMHCFYLYRV